MRKFTMFVLLATSAIPAMAAAQDGWRHGRQSQSEASDDRPSRPERSERAERAERPQREARQEVQAERQVQQQMQVQQQVQSQRQNGDREGLFARIRDGRVRDQSAQQDNQSSRDERMQQYRQQMEQRQAQQGGQQSPDGAFSGRQGRYRPGSGVNPNAGQPAPVLRDGQVASRHDSRNRWSSNWRNDNRYDWRRYRDRHHSTFRIGFYFDPFGYSYRRFGIGSFLYPSYYQSNYWINDPWQYRLPPAYGPYRWVRYHNDALLIDTWNGEVVDVIYGFFW